MLLKRSKSGQMDAFESLIKEHQKRVYNIALRMLGNPEDAYDAAQEVFLRVYKSLHGFKGQSSFSTWIFRITKNVCLDELRKRNRRNFISIDKEIEYGDGSVQMQIEDERPTPEEAAERAELSNNIKDAISMLPEQHRILIILRDIQNFSYEEIAGILQIPDGTVKSRINRARSALREIINGSKELFNVEYVK
ncbi:MAG: sigma-70 family RNA polymerase sigma factor [Eubacteriales bacterium]|nr:sigma-70 family RNA polymerase sigma factor [Eubacteriales bacterium]